MKRFQENHPVVAVLVVATLLVGVPEVMRRFCPVFQDVKATDFWGIAANGATFFALFFAGWQWAKANKDQAESAKHAAILSVHQHLNERNMYALRRYLYNGYKSQIRVAVSRIVRLIALENTLEATEPPQAQTPLPDFRGLVPSLVEKINEMTDSHRNAYLTDWRQFWQSVNVTIDGVELETLDAVEHLLLQIDLIAALWVLEQSSIQDTKDFWAPVVARMLEELMPFMEVERALRGQKDYKLHTFRLAAQLKP